MKTQLATVPGRHDHPPQPVHSPQPHAVRRVGPLDRAALHLGLALVKWGRRPVRVDQRERIALDAETIEARRTMQRVRDQHQATQSRMR